MSINNQLLTNQEIKTLYDILKKEQESGFKNNTVFGGISLFSKKIENLLQKQTGLSTVLNDLKNYNNLPIKQREFVVCNVLSTLEKFLSYETSLTPDQISLDKTPLNEIPIAEINLEKISFLNTPLEKFSSSLDLNKRILSILKKAGIKNLKDLLWFFPRSYSDRTKELSLPQAVNQEKSFLVVEILSEHFVISSEKKKLKIIKYLSSDSYGYKGELVFFNQDYIVYQLKKGKKIRVFARVTKNKTYQIIPEEWEYYEEKTLNFNRIVPHYPISISPKKIRQILYNALKIAYKYIEDPLIPFLKDTQTKFVFRDLAKSIINLHFPTSFEELDISRNRVALEEIIYTQMLLSGISKTQKSMYKINKEESLRTISKINLPFELTEAQKKVISEIIDDFAGEYPTRRLVQGDVGAGKTIVAFLACYLISSQGYQSCIMAPTEILATQHFNNFQKFFPNSKVELLTSKIKGKQRQKILTELKEGNIEVLIGTHALIEENVEFKNLALVVIDEQHKFGVNQRFRLYSKSDCPHLIVMSATPIPRTLALTVYSDLDISVINQMPPGRKKAITEIFNYKDINKVYNFIERELREGRQAYIVCPSIFENPKMDLKNVQTIYLEIKERFSNYQVAYLHGKMNPKEKDEVMEKFRQNIYSILISTTVVEVGVDVPNANVIVILDAERFGLSQLHQLRGRVKRSSHQPYCLLVTSKNLSSLEFNKSLQRLSILKYYDDGFKIAEKDLELRGPGEILGYKQHGFTEFKVLNPIKDQELIKFSNYLARQIYSIANQSPFFIQKLNEIKTQIELISDTI